MTINQFEKDPSEKDPSLSVRNSIGNHQNGKTRKNQLKRNVTINVTPKTTLLTTMEITTMVHKKENRIQRTTIPPADQYENDDEDEEEREDE